MTRQPPSRWLPSYLVMVLLWGSSFAFIKLALTVFTPFGIGALRTMIAAVTLLIALVITRTPFAPRRIWPLLLVNILLAGTIPWALTAFGELHLSSAFTAIVGSTGPLFTLVAVLIAFPEERPTWPRMVGLGLGFVGVVTVVGPWTGVGAAVWIGVVAVLVANMVWGWSGPFSRRYLTGGIKAGTVDPLALAAGMFVMGSIAVIPVATVVPVTHGDVTTSGVVGILFLGIFSSGIATTMNLRVIGRADATTASTALYLAPLVAVLIGTLFLGETLTWNAPVGGAIILVGAALAQGLIRFGDRSVPLQPDDV
ncbi:MAG: DMT family transporter [Actinobacteria bacterium]|nr:DMT family transporter [Actinomycetota bacterium]